MKTFEIVTVGHFAVDQIIHNHAQKPKKTLGGPAAYCSLAAAKLGARVGVVSKVGDDFPKAYTKLLREQSVNLFGVKTENSFTTSFTLRYLGGKRSLFLKRRAPPILPEDLPHGFRAKVVHVAPIADEISVDCVNELCKRATMLSIDPQGFLRRFSADGRVSAKKWKDEEILGKVDIYKSSLSETRTVTGLEDLKASMRKIQSMGPRIVIITLGEKGATLLHDGRFHRIPGIRIKVKDTTGCGDVFAGAFLAELVRGKNPVRCACVASAMASFKAETLGPVVAPEREAVYRRADLCEKCMHTETHNGL